MTPLSDPNVLVKQILVEPAFRNMHAGFGSPSFWDNITAWFRDLVAPLFAGANAGLDALTLSTFGNVLLVLALCGIAFVVFRFGIRMTAGFAPYRLPRSSAAHDRIGLPDLRRAAAEAAEKSQYALAIALLFQASLQVLDEARIVRYDASRTAGEYERLLGKSQSSALEPFRIIARKFVLIAFAAVSAGTDDYAVCQKAIVALEAAVV